MKRVIGLVLVLGLIAVACGDDDGTPLFTSTTTNASGSTTTTIGGDLYPSEMVEAYMDGCRPDGGEDLCRCTIDQYQDRLTIEEFLDYTANTEDIATDPLALEIIDFVYALARTPPRPSPGVTSHHSSASTRSSTPPLPISTCIGWRPCRRFGARLRAADRERSLLHLPGRPADVRRTHGRGRLPGQRLLLRGRRHSAVGPGRVDGAAVRRVR